jgi:hypothetical protein
MMRFSPCPTCGELVYGDGDKPCFACQEKEGDMSDVQAKAYLVQLDGETVVVAAASFEDALAVLRRCNDGCGEGETLADFVESVSVIADRVIA